MNVRPEVIYSFWSELFFLSFHYFQPEVLLAVCLISAYLVCYENRHSNRWWKTKCSQNTAMEIVIWISIKSNPFCTTVFSQHHHLTSITAGCGQVWSVVLGVYITHLLRLPEKHIVTSIWQGKPDHLNDCRRRLNLERAAKHCFQSGAKEGLIQTKSGVAAISFRLWGHNWKNVIVLVLDST